MSRETVGDEVRSGDLTVEGTVAADAATVSGNVGIGTSSPQYRLDVVGSSGSGARISNSGGLSGSTPSTTHAELIIDSADANLGIQILGTSTSDQRILFGDSSSSGAGSIRYNHAGDYLALSCAATERMRIDNAGLITGSGTSLGAWTAYTPTLGGTGWAIGNGGATARYAQIGKIVVFKGSIVFGSTSTFGAGALTLTVPVTGVSGSNVNGQIQVAYQDTSASTAYAGSSAWTSTTTFQPRAIGSGGVHVQVTNTTPITWASGDIIWFSGTYEAA